jgi:predicted RNA binding protein YcfA (HicA-like mRNA interferase family)
MPKIPAITGKELIKLLQSMGFEITRTKGSHVRLWLKDKKATTVPIHGNKAIPKGLLRKIIREDLEMSMKEFFNIYSKYKKKG